MRREQSIDVTPYLDPSVEQGSIRNGQLLRIAMRAGVDRLSQKIHKERSYRFAPVQHTDREMMLFSSLLAINTMQVVKPSQYLATPDNPTFFFSPQSPQEKDVVRPVVYGACRVEGEKNKQLYRLGGVKGDVVLVHETQADDRNHSKEHLLVSVVGEDDMLEQGLVVQEIVTWKDAAVVSADYRTERFITDKRPINQFTTIGDWMPVIQEIFPKMAGMYAGMRMSGISPGLLTPSPDITQAASKNRRPPFIPG